MMGRGREESRQGDGTSPAYANANANQAIAPPGRGQHQAAGPPCRSGGIVAMVLIVATACMVPPRMCASEGDCGALASCVAGRCVAKGATAAIDTAHRLLIEPVDVAYVRADVHGRGARGDGTVPAIATLGAARDESAMILVRFALSLPPEANVLEAYLLLERVTDIDADPGRLVLHTARIVDPWDSRSVSWANPPGLRDTGAPVTPVSGPGATLVRLDVRSVVQRWRRRRGDDFGIAVTCEERGALGVAFALTPVEEARYDPVLAPGAAPVPPPLSPFDPHPALPASIADPRRQLVGPRLELYVK